MAYNAKTNWKHDDPVMEDDFNRIEQGIKDAHDLIEATQQNISRHEERRDNPHHVTKAQVGLGNVDNVKQATKSEFDAHNLDHVRHVTELEKEQWNKKSRIQLSAEEPNYSEVTWWFEDLGESEPFGGGGLLIGNASLESGSAVWFDKNI